MPRRFRTFLLWAAFALAAIAGGLAVYRLYASVQREIAVQSERAVQQERTRFLERMKTYTDEVRRSIITDLASFHADGLGPALRQWDVANEIITGTFVCDPVQGFAPDFTAPAGAPSRDKLAEFWQQFRAWRAQHPAAIAQADSVHAGPWQTLDYRLLDNAAFPAGDLGYQGENLELITQTGRRADPWAGWAGCTDDPRAPWVFWYQAGPEETVRGCFVEIGPILRQLRSEISSSGSVRLEIVPVAASDPILDSATLLPWLPGCRLTTTPGEVFLRKASDARLTALVAALLFGAFLTGVAALTVFTRRESHEAERKINFVAQVSHELRTPLTSIRMYADLLTAAGLTDEKRFRFAGTISTESQRLGALIERLLAFNALEKGNGKIVCASIDVGALVRATIEETDSSLRSAGLRIELNLPVEPVVAWSEHSALKQALLNLLDNAGKYAGDGSLVCISLTSDAAKVRLRVADGGPGVPRAIRHRLFEPFVQGGQSPTNKSPGVGLGLSIARGMLRQAGGDLVLLDAGNGAVFEIILPRNPPGPGEKS